MEELFGLSKVEETLFARAAAKQIPIYGGFELTPYCNLSCKMCYVHETKPGLPLLRTDKWLDFGRQAVEAGTLCKRAFILPRYLPNFGPTVRS